MYTELDPFIMLTITQAEHHERLIQAERRALLRQRQATRRQPTRRHQPRPHGYQRRLYLWYLRMWRGLVHTSPPLVRQAFTHASRTSKV
jgi:hypothetical protein